MAWWLIPRTPDPEVGGSSPTRVKTCCVLEQGTFTPQIVLVIPRKRWLRPNMNGKLFTGTLRINHPTNSSFIRGNGISLPQECAESGSRTRGRLHVVCHTLERARDHARSSHLNKLS